jgi:xanthine dehydrogenase molybdopterin-binding subunit B
MSGPCILRLAITGSAAARTGDRAVLRGGHAPSRLQDDLRLDKTTLASSIVARVRRMAGGFHTCRTQGAGWAAPRTLRRLRMPRGLA